MNLPTSSSSRSPKNKPLAQTGADRFPVRGIESVRYLRRDPKLVGDFAAVAADLFHSPPTRLMAGADKLN